MNTVQSMLLLPLVTICSLSTVADDGYKNFEVSVYARVFEVIKMKDPVWLKSTLNNESASEHRQDIP
jgi:hypothetical protein